MENPLKLACSGISLLISVTGFQKIGNNLIYGLAVVVKAFL